MYSNFKSGYRFRESAIGDGDTHQSYLWMRGMYAVHIYIDARSFYWLNHLSRFNSIGYRSAQSRSTYTLATSILIRHLWPSPSQSNTHHPLHSVVSSVYFSCFSPSVTSTHGHPISCRKHHQPQVLHHCEHFLWSQRKFLSSCRYENVVLGWPGFSRSHRSFACIPDYLSARPEERLQLLSPHPLQLLVRCYCA